MTWVMGACAVAKQIKEVGRDCQDAFALEKVGGNKVVAVIADGAGSAPKAKQGARLVVENALKYMKKFDLDKLSDRTMHQLHTIPTLVRDEIRKEAEKNKEDPNDYASTLIATVFMPDRLIGLQVGDGFLVSGVEDEYDLVFSGKKGEYVNETNFVTDDTLDVQSFVQREPIDFVALATDGLEHVAIDQRLNQAHIGFFKPFDKFLQDNPSRKTIDSELEKFLKSERLQQRSNDDRTLIIAKFLGSQ